MPRKCVFGGPAEQWKSHYTINNVGQRGAKPPELIARLNTLFELNVRPKWADSQLTTSLRLFSRSSTNLTYRWLKLNQVSSQIADDPSPWCDHWHPRMFWSFADARVVDFNGWIIRWCDVTDRWWSPHGAGRLPTSANATWTLGHPRPDWSVTDRTRTSINPNASPPRTAKCIWRRVRGEDQDGEAEKRKMPRRRRRRRRGREIVSVYRVNRR